MDVLKNVSFRQGREKSFPICSPFCFANPSSFDPFLCCSAGERVGENSEGSNPASTTGSPIFHGNAAAASAIAADPRKSKKFLNQWKQAASMSKITNRTKNLLGKWKSHSQSVDIGGATHVYDGSHDHHGAMSGLGSDPGGPFGLHGSLDCGGSGPATPPNAQQAQSKQQQAPQSTAKAKWTEHVWSEYFFGCAFFILQIIRKSRLLSVNIYTDFSDAFVRPTNRRGTARL